MHDDSSSSPGFVPFMFLILFAAAMFGWLVGDVVPVAPLAPTCEVTRGN